MRDGLLGLPVTERDWVVVGATPEVMLSSGFRQADPEFPVFLHPQTGEEYALARREFKIGSGYRGFRIDASPDVTLAEDLARRDLTINAMARDEADRLIDLHGGAEDLSQGLLRHVTPAFVEDPVRLLRIARFAARFGDIGFRVAHSTHRLMKQMVAGGAVSELRPQRIWQELHKAMGYAQPWRFFEVLHACGALRELIPDLADCMQGGEHGVSDNCINLDVLKSSLDWIEEPDQRLAALLLSLPEDTGRLRSRLGLSRRVKDWLQVARAVWPRVRRLERLTPVELESLLRDLGAWREGERFADLLRILRVQPQAPASLDRLQALRLAGREVSIRDLRARGLKGAELGQAVREARCRAIAKAWH